MSLINDALKRAKHAPRKPAPPVADALPLRPVEPPQPLSGSGRFFAPMMLVATLAVGAPLIWVTIRFANRPAPVRVLAAPVPSPKQTDVASRATVTPPAAVTTPLVALPSPLPQPAIAPPVSASAPASAAAPAPIAANPDAVSTTPLPSGSPSAHSAPAAEPASPPPPPALPKLQGIFYRAQRPAALVNGRMVLVGGMVGEHRVAAIGPHAVTLVRAGETNVLTLE